MLLYQLKIIMTKKRVFVAGHRGMVGRALVRQLEKQDDVELVLRDRDDLDLVSQPAVTAFFKHERIHQVYLAAAKVGGIYANDHYPADFIYDNIMIAANIIHASFVTGVPQLLFLGSSCIYPKLAAQPMKEDSLLDGHLEPTNEPYAIAKIAGIKLCESYNRQHGTDYRAVMPTNLYGAYDNFHAENSHVLAALLRRFHEAKQSGAPEVTVWGDGSAQREFLHVDDLSKACIHVLALSKTDYARVTTPMCSHLNVGSGEEVTIKQLSKYIAETVGYAGRIVFDAHKPNGTPRKLTDTRRLKALGWQAKLSLKDGLKSTYDWLLTHYQDMRQ